MYVWAIRALAKHSVVRLLHAKQLMHGKGNILYLPSQRGVFRNLPNPFIATRYHSLVVERSTLPDCLEVTAWTEDDEIMGLRHKTLAIEGIQFHRRYLKRAWTPNARKFSKCQK